jgi:hypothetical protein
MGTVALLAAACVDNANGSKIELFLHGGVQVPADPPVNGRPPSDTHYEIWVLRDTSVFHIADFDIRPALKMEDPCFIEEEGARFAGLHSTKIYAKLLELARQHPDSVTPIEAGDIASAKVRVGAMLALETGLKAMTGHEPGLTEARIAELTADVPDPNLTDDASNAQRLARCKQIWHDHPGYYVATDKVLTIPLNGTYYGLVEATDPRNNGLVGGGSIETDLSFPQFDALRVNWNWNDPNDTRKDSYPPSNIGYHYMAGKPEDRVRGVINVTVVNQDFGSISGEVSIYTDLARDDVHF